ncbi:MAG TPA: DNA polymerase I [Thermodesulfobacteriaceae bacterium]|nr:DNA polymerase I [Thermodesulfobacteriaceae bacterium]
MEIKEIQGDSPLYLIDGSSYIYRAYFAIRQSLTTSSGFPTKAVLGITNMLWKVLQEKDPRYVGVIWDAKGPTFRHELYESYKANRPPMPDDLTVQIPYIRELVDALGLVQVEINGFEADDIIATITRKVSDRHPVIVVSGDKDLLQLVGPRVILWDSMKDQVTDLTSIREKIGLEPEKLLDVMTLSGDASDNIPGVPGIGPKTAVKLIRQYGSVDNLLVHLDEIKGEKLRERLEASRDRLPLMRKLVALSYDVPVDADVHAYERRPPDHEKLRKVFQELELTRLLQRLAPEKTIAPDRYELIQTEEELARWRDMAQEASSLCIDTETTSEFPMEAELVGLSICVEPPCAGYIPLGHRCGDPQLGRSDVVRILGPLFADPATGKVGQNIKYDLIVLANHGMELAGIEGDTMIASYLLNPSRHRHNLGEIAQEILGHRMISFQEVTADQKKKKNFALVPLDAARDYSCEDVHVTALVKEVLWKKLRENSLWDLFENVEVPLIRILADMEMAGILIDREKLEGLSGEFAARLAALEEEIYGLAGEKFNINSTKQLAAILFEKLNLPQKKKTRKKTGYSTDVEVLKELAGLHELPRSILAYRNLAKLKSTYVDGLARMLNARTGRVHTSFNQTVTATGRLSSSDPNLQNIPVRTEEGRRIRSLFTAPEGCLLLSADYSQIDLRVLAHYSGDPSLISAFRNDEDIHRLTAAEVFEVSPMLVTPEMRRVAKTVNFGIIYGMSAYGLAKELGISRKEAKEFIDRYFRRYPGVKRYMESVVEQAREQGYVTTLLGRRRYIPDLVSRVKSVREFAERTAINTPIQGTAADIIKLAMIRVDSALKSVEPPCRMLLQVHDELILEVPEDQVKQAACLVKESMENVMDMDVPLRVAVGWGRNWAGIDGK